MRKALTSALAALTFGGAVAATAAPAEARDRHHGYSRGHHGGSRAGVAVAAGIAGLALGAALSDGRGRGRSGYAYGGGYNNGYATGYNNGYGYDPRYDGYSGDYYARGPRICITRERVWDPYIGRHVSIERQYPC